MLSKKSTYVLLSMFLSLNLFASENCGYEMPEIAYSCEGSFKAKSLTDLEKYRTEISSSNDTYRNLVIRFDLNEANLNLASPCSIKFKKALNINFSGETCIHSGKEVIFNNNSNLTFENLKITANTKIAIRRENNVSGGNLTLDTTNKNGESRIHFRKDSEIAIDSLKATAYQKITLGKNIDFKANNSVELYVLDNESEEVEGKVAFFKDGNIEASSITAFSVDKVKFNKNVFVMTEELNVFATECKDKNAGGGTNEACSNPNEPTLNEIPIAEMRCFTPRKSNILCTASASSDSDGIVNLYKFMVNGVVYEQETVWFSLNIEEGTYQVSLEVVDNEGAISDLISSEVQVLPNQAPRANFDCTVTEDTKLSCDANLSYDPDDAELNYLWKVNGAYYNEVSNIFDVGTASSVEVTLTVSDFFGGSDTISKTFDVRPENIAPVASMICESNSPGSLRCDATESYDLDGSISKYGFYVDSDYFENTTGIIEVNNLLGATYVSLVVYDDLQLESEEIYSIIEIAQNISPVAFLDCETGLKQRVSCNASASYDPDGTISEYIFEVFGKEYRSTSFTLDEIVDLYGGVNVSLRVIDNYGKSSNTVYNYIAVEQNRPPNLAVMSCTPDGAQRLNCSAEGSNDLDDSFEDLTFEWTYDDGKVAYGLNSVLTFSNSGEQSIKLKVIDPFGASKSIEQTWYALPNNPPLNSFLCSSSKPFEVSCNASQSSDNDGEIVEYRWFINNEFITSTSSPFFEGLAEGESLVNVRLDVVDNLDGVTTASRFSVVKQPEFYGDIFCEQIDNFKIRCSPQGLATDYGEITDYEWSIDGEQVSTQRTFEISFDSAGLVNVSLLAKTNIDSHQKSVQKEFELLELPSSTFNSDLNLALNVDKEKIVQAGQPIIFSTESGEIASGVSIRINNNIIDDELLFISSTNIEIDPNFEYNEGRNEIEISFLDGEGKSFSRNYTLFLGSKDIEIDFVNDIGNSKDITLIIPNDNNRTFKYEDVGTEINKIPALDLVLIASEKDGRSRIAFLKKEELGVSFDLDSDFYPLNESNHNFLSGDSGWSIEKGNYDFSTDYPDSYDQIQEGEKLMLTPNEDGIIHYSSELLISKEGTSTLDIPLLFNSSNEKSFYVLRYKNKESSEELIKVVNINDVGSSSAINSRYIIDSIASKDSDLVEVEVFAMFYDFTQEVSWNLFDTLLPKSFANNQNNSLINGPFTSAIAGIKKIEYLEDVTGKDVGDPMANIPTGQFGFEPSISFYSFNRSFDFLAQIELVREDLIKEVNFLICPDNGSKDILECKKIPALNVNDKYYLSYLSNQIQINTNHMEVLIEVIEKDTNRAIRRNFKAFKKGSSNNTYFRNIVVADRYLNYERYGDIGEFGNFRDEHVGGDSWISYGHRQIFNRLLSNTADFKNSTGDTKSYRIKANDINGIQGHSNGRKEQDLKHRSHNDGIKVDLRWSLTNESSSKIKQGNSSGTIDSYEDAVAIGNLVSNNSKEIEEVLVTNDNLQFINKIRQMKYENDFYNSFVQVIASSCLRNGRLLSDIVKHNPGHSHHIDLKLRDFNIDRTTFQNLDKTYYDLNSQVIFTKSSAENEISFNGPDGYNKRLFYEKAGKITLIPLSESKDHPVYLDGTTIKLSSSFIELHGISDYLVFFNEIQFNIKGVFFDSQGCGENSRTFNFKLAEKNVDFEYEVNNLDVLFSGDLNFNKEAYSEYIWNIDGVEKTINNDNLYAHTFSDYGVKKVSLKVKDKYGYESIIVEKTITIPKTEITVCSDSVIDNSMTVTFSDTLSVGVSTVINHPDGTDICYCKKLRVPNSLVTSNVYLDTESMTYKYTISMNVKVVSSDILVFKDGDWVLGEVIPFIGEVSTSLEEGNYLNFGFSTSRPPRVIKDGGLKRCEKIIN